MDVKRNPHITLNKIWYKLKINKGYIRKPASLYRGLRRIGHYNNSEIKGTSKKHDKEYHKPKGIGVKWQIDAKYVAKMNVRQKKCKQIMELNSHIINQM